MTFNLTKGNLPLIKFFGELGSSLGASHFNLTFYDTSPGDKGDPYDPLPENNHTDIISLEDFMLQEFMKRVNSPSEAVGLCSIFRLKDGRFAHMRQLDIDSTNVRAPSLMDEVKAILAGMNGSYRQTKNIRSYLIDSGTGCHYVEEGSLTDSQWKEWLANAEKLEGLVHQQWVKASRERGYSALRLNSTRYKPNAPKLFCRLAI